jgi:phosphoenolpyruvate synthase/pyruvate phosphate dikinase
MAYSGSKTKNIKTTKNERETFSINNAEIIQLAKSGLAIENHYSKLAIVGTNNATELLRDGDTVTVSCCKGEDGYVYEGALEYKIEKMDLKDLKPKKTKLFMNVGDPRKEFSLAKLPNSGVGLARIVRTSDFKLNEYKNMLGGRDYEKDEENPI